MGFQEKLSSHYTNKYLEKNGERLTQVQGNALSVKVETKTIFFIFHIITASILVRPDRSKVTVKCQYKKKKFFKKPTFMTINQGNSIIVQGLKPNKTKKEVKDYIEILNIKNLSTKRDLIPQEGGYQPVKAVRKVERR